MAKVVDVTDVPEVPGAGLLHFDDGRPPMMALPEIANDYRSHLGLNALDNGVAGPGTGTPDLAKQDRDDFVNTMKGVGNWFVHGDLSKPLGQQSPQAAPAAQSQPLPPNVRVASPQEWDATHPPQPAQQPAPGGPGPQPAQQAVPQAIAAPDAAQQPPEQSLQDQALAASDARLANELLTGRQSGVPGTARPAGFSPDTKKITTQAGPAYDVRAAGDRIDAGEAVLQAQMAQAASQKEQADAMASHAAAQNLAAQQQVRDQQAEIQRKQQAYQQQDQRLQTDLADFSESAKPDPKKYFSTPGGALSGMLSIIGQGLGAFGATLGRTQNWAFDAAQNQLRMEMAAQEKAYDAGRGDRKNALARLTDYYHGDLDKGKLALSQALNKVAETETLNFGAQSRSKEIGSNAQVLAAQFRQQQLLDEQKRVELAQGTTTTEATDKYHQATSGGGPRLSLEHELAIRKYLQPKGKDQGALGLTARSVATAKTQYGTKKEQIERLYSSFDEEAKLLGLAVDKETGTLIDPETGRPAREPKKSPGIGYIAGHIPDALAGEEGRALRRARANSARLHAQTIYDKSITAEEAEHEIPTVMGKSPGDEMNSLKQRIHELSQYDYQLDATAASIDPRIVNERSEAKKDVNVSRATKQPLPGPKARPGVAAADTGSESEGDGG